MESVEMYATDHTRLRRPTADDLDRIRQLESDPDVVRWTPMRTPRTEEQSRQRLENQIKANTGQQLYGYWLAETRDSRDFIGWFMIVEIDPGQPAIGFMLIRTMWNKGFAREISTRLIAAVFSETACTQILATADLENTTSHKTLLALGFEVTGTDVQADKIQDREFPIRHYRLIKAQS
jgi:ribosomal-protein-alanine N-acetyltransferase